MNSVDRRIFASSLVLTMTTTMSLCKLAFILGNFRDNFHRFCEQLFSIFDFSAPDTYIVVVIAWILCLQFAIFFAEKWTTIFVMGITKKTKCTQLNCVFRLAYNAIFFSIEQLSAAYALAVLPAEVDSAKRDASANGSRSVRPMTDAVIACSPATVAWSASIVNLKTVRICTFH